MLSSCLPPLVLAVPTRHNRHAGSGDDQLYQKVSIPKMLLTNGKAHQARTLTASALCRACREELEDQYDAFDEGVFCRSRFWLFVSYLVSTSAIIGSILVLLHFYAWNSDVPTLWPGVAGVFQVILVLGSALLFFVSRSGGGTDEYGGYSGF